MAFNQNIAQEYNRNKILTASPAELTLMLYEGAIKFCNIALIAIEKGDLQKEFGVEGFDTYVTTDTFYMNGDVMKLLWRKLILILLRQR